MCPFSSLSTKVWDCASCTCWFPLWGAWDTWLSSWKMVLKWTEIMLNYRHMMAHVFSCSWLFSLFQALRVSTGWDPISWGGASPGLLVLLVQASHPKECWLRSQRFLQNHNPLLYQKLGVDYSLVGGFKPKAQKGILLSDTMRVSVVQSGREIDMMDEESESARNSRTRSLRRQLQANPAPESPSASQRLRAVEQGTHPDDDQRHPRLYSRSRSTDALRAERACDRRHEHGRQMAPSGWGEFSAKPHTGRKRGRD